MIVPIFILLAFYMLLMRLISSFALGSDAPVHFWRALRLKRFKTLSHYQPDSIIGEVQHYPKLSHFIFSKIPVHYWGISAPLFNFIFDFILVCCVALYSVYVLDYDPFFSTLIAAVCGTSPSWCPIDARSKSISGRVMGNFFVGIFFFCWLVYVQYDYALVAFLGAICFVVVALTSQFAFQVILFVSVIVSVLLPSYFFLIILLLVMPIFLVDAFKVRSTIYFWISHKYWYLSNLSDIDFVRGRDFRSIIKIHRLSIFKIIHHLFFKNPYFISLLYVPYLIFFFIVLLQQGALHLDVVGLQGIGIAFGIVSLATSLGVLRIFGEAERYLEYAVPFLSLLLGAACFEYSCALEALLFLVFLQVIVSLLFMFISLDPRSLFQNYIERFNVSNLLKQYFESEIARCGHVKVAVVPVKSAMLLSLGLVELSKTDNIKFLFRHMEDGTLGMKYMEKLFGGKLADVTGEFSNSQEMFNVSCADLSANYGITHVVLDRKYLDRIPSEWRELFEGRPDGCSPGAVDNNWIAISLSDNCSG